MTPTLERFVEDRLREQGKSRSQFANEMGHRLGMDYTTTRLTRRINTPRDFPADELAAFADLLKIKDWFGELVINFGAGLDGCTVSEFDKMLHPQGCQLGRVNVAA
ncbi:hypothetical protein SAMN05444359_12646 [Neolewinella agarilytica]|uniref:Uncharacterized protein n=1 Tax=Neolewinella agarilytica TaxID=478744 RepID=A0A1H9LZ51_9BACT|nr:hypothetical protein SAMN05444359_12646 [Neolewinella agarilytica]